MKIIRSSEVANYVYCPLCWWKSIKEGVKVTPKMREGEKFHQQIAARRSKARFLHASIILIMAVFIFLVIFRLIG